MVPFLTFEVVFLLRLYKKKWFVSDVGVINPRKNNS